MHEVSLIDGECELNYKKHRGIRGEKNLIFLHITSIFIFASVIRINALGAMHDIFIPAFSKSHVSIS